MKSYFILLVFLLMGCKEVTTENILTDEVFFGKVKSVETNKFYAFDSIGKTFRGQIYDREPSSLAEFNEFGNITQRINYIYGKPEVNSKAVLKYNKHNKLTEDIRININDSVTSTTFYKYDRNNNLIEIVTDNFDYKEFNFKSIYIYDRNNNLTEEQFYHDSTYIFTSKIIYNYNPKNKISEAIYYRTDGAFPLIKSIYDNNENVILKKEYDKSGDLEFIYTYKYNRENNVTEEIKSDSSNNFISKLVYTYDSKGNILEEKKVGKNEIILSSSIYSYKYDKKGNWIEKTYLIDKYYPKNKYLIERKIDYYN